jgi:hypothetical protein
VQPLSVRTPQHGCRQAFQAWLNHKIKIACVSCPFTFLRFYFFSMFPIFTCDIALNLIYILKEQSNEEDFSLFFMTQTWFRFALTPKFVTSLCFSGIFVVPPIHPPLCVTP